MRGVGDAFERGGASEIRSDREMSTDMLADSVKGALEARGEFLESSREETLTAVRMALGWRMEGDSLLPPTEEAAQAGSVAQLPPEEMEALPRDDLIASVHRATQTNALQARTLWTSAIEKKVEIHKKYSIAFACIVFVLLGAPLAVRFPRGGVGMVITVSVVIFAIFWVSLIGGEALADRGYVGPAMAMWAPNLLLFPYGVYLVRGMSRQVATARGGGWEDLLFTLANGIRRPVRTVLRRKRG
jgi:lipopolysaccharide export system permease protein